MDRLRTILTAVDFTPCSASALRQAIRISKWSRATLKVVHIVATDVVIELEASLTPLQTGIREGLIADARRAWEAFSAQIPGADELQLGVEINHPVAALLHRVVENSVDLLVLGAFGTSAPSSGAGTLATACVRKATTKVMLIQEGHAGPFRSVLACIDFSETSRRALEQAIRLCLQDSAKLYVLHVFAGPWRRLHYRAPTPQATSDFIKQPFARPSRMN